MSCRQPWRTAILPPPLEISGDDESETRARSFPCQPATVHAPPTPQAVGTEKARHVADRSAIGHPWREVRCTTTKEDGPAQRSITASMNSNRATNPFHGRAAYRHERDDAANNKRLKHGDKIANKRFSNGECNRRFDTLRQRQKAAYGAIVRIMVRRKVRCRCCGLVLINKLLVVIVIVRTTTILRARMQHTGQAMPLAHMPVRKVVQTMLKTRQCRQQDGKSSGGIFLNSTVHGRTQFDARNLNAVRPDRSIIDVADRLVNGIYATCLQAVRLAKRIRRIGSTDTIAATDTTVTGWTSHVGGTQRRRPSRNLVCEGVDGGKQANTRAYTV
ncbi:MAG: hypothetical protein KatS3mg111_1878 [Pirellulaceae bacterium]|nr:MAG: hypothetical protein KatS3mg111_1878 [Pirellulaceae bacterium]